MPSDTSDISGSAQISPMADIERSSRGSRLVIGEGCVIDSFVKIKFAGGGGDVIIGSHTFINSGCVFYSGNGIVIGNNVLIAANTTLAATNHAVGDPSRPIRMQGFAPSRGGIVVDDDVWIGANVVVLDGVRIGRGAVIGAGSMVNRPVEPLTIVGGSPLRVLGVRGGVTE